MKGVRLTPRQQDIIELMQTYHQQGDDYVHTSDLAEAMDVTSSAISQHMKRLLDVGLVERSPEPRSKSGKPGQHPYRLTGAA